MLEILKKIQLYGFSRSLKFIVEELYRLLVFKLLQNSYSQHGKTIDFLSAGTEGTDLVVLESNNWKRFKPKVICVETKGNLNKIKSFLEAQGYAIKHKNGINSIFSVS